MIAVDTNILIYAHRTDSPFNDAAARALTRLAEGHAAWAVPWPCLHEFLAVVTHPQVYDPPATIDAALGFVDGLLESPTLVVLAETEAHWPILRSLVVRGQITRGRIHDARIAALCIQHGVTQLWSADRDFNRFPELTVVNPLIA